VPPSTVAVARTRWRWSDVGVEGPCRRHDGGADVVLKVNGRPVHVPQYQQALHAAYHQFRRQGAGPLTRENEQQISDQVVKQLVQQVLFVQEYWRLGITVCGLEVYHSERGSSPPEVLTTHDFHTICRL